MAKKKPQNNLIVTALIAIAGFVYFSMLSSKRPSTTLSSETMSKMENEEPASKQSAKNSAVVNQSTVNESTVNKSTVNESLGIEENAMLEATQAPTEPPSALSNTVSVPSKSGARIERLNIDPNQLPPDLPADLRAQLLEPPLDIPPELEAQVNAPRGELPEDIKKALQTPPREVPAEEVNLTPEEFLEP